jgi:hypothetical protein
MKNQVIEFEINQINGIADLKKLVLNKSQQEVIQSVVNNGQNVPICLDEDNNIIDGKLRVLGTLKVGGTVIDAIVIPVHDSSQSKAKAQYVANIHRRNMSAAEKADLATDASGNFVDDDTNLKLGIKSSLEDESMSKSHVTKFKRISELPLVVKSKINEYEIPVNASYELGKGSKNQELDKEELVQLVDAIKDMSDRKAVAHIKKFIKNKSSNADVNNEDVVVSDVESVKFKRTSITINITKHFEDEAFTLDKLTEQNKQDIKELIDRVFEYLKNDYFTANNQNATADAAESSQEVSVMQIDVTQEHGTSVEG